LSCLPRYTKIDRGKDVASFRIIPLFMSRQKFYEAVSDASNLQVRPFRNLKVSLLSTGSEVEQGLIRDQSLERIEPRVKDLGGEIFLHVITGDGTDRISARIREVIQQGAELVICTGGMSVDADDTTRAAMEKTASEILFRRVPTLPGCNLELVMAEGVPVIGVPAGVLYYEWSTLDLILPMVFAGVYPGREEVYRWGTRGLGCRFLPREV
nr:molybdopterin-binding protein [Synergistales bacterium]